MLSIQPTCVLIESADHKPLCNATLSLVVRTRFSYASPFRLCFKNPQWKLPIKAKPSLETYIHMWPLTSTIQISLSPSRITGLSHQSRQLLCGQRESNPGFQLVELQCYHRALAHNLVIVVAKLLLSIFVNPKKGTNGKIEYRQELWKATLYLHILYCMYLYIIHYT